MDVRDVMTSVPSKYADAVILVDKANRREALRQRLLALNYRFPPFLEDVSDSDAEDAMLFRKMGVALRAEWCKTRVWASLSLMVVGVVVMFVTGLLVGSCIGGWLDANVSLAEKHAGITVNLLLLVAFFWVEVALPLLGYSYFRRAKEELHKCYEILAEVYYGDAYLALHLWFLHFGRAQ